MNDRMNLLVKKAGIDFGNFESVTVDIAEIEELIRLIAQESIDVVNNAELGYNDYRSQIEEGMRNHCVELLRTHFGVEE